MHGPSDHNEPLSTQAPFVGASCTRLVVDGGATGMRAALVRPSIVSPREKSQLRLPMGRNRTAIDAVFAKVSRHRL